MARIARLFLCTCFIQFFATHASGQGKPAVLLTDYIRILERDHALTFLFDNDLVRGIKVQADTTLLDLAIAKENLRSLKAFEFNWNGSTVLITPRKEKANLFICGTVVQEGGQEAIPGANIFDDRRTIETSANESGYFEASGKLATDNNITITSVGYLPATLPIAHFNGTGCPVIEMKLSTEILKDVVINAYMTTGIDYNFRENAIVIQPGKMGLLPGETDADILMTLDALPGINSPDSKAGNLIIRGTTPDQSLTTFDNIPIYHKGHYFGTNSPYNPMVVDNVKILRSAYTAERGGRVGGVIEINSTNQLKDSATYAVSLSTTYGSAVAEVPIMKDRLSVLVAARTSFPHEWKSPKLEAINDFVYQHTRVREAEISPSLHLKARDYYFNDFNVKVISHLSHNSALTASLLLIHNDIDIGIESDVEKAVTYDNMQLVNRGLNLQWEKQWSDRLKTIVSGTQSVYDQAYTSTIVAVPEDTVKASNYFDNQLKDVQLRLGSEFRFNRVLSSTFGYELNHHAQQYFNTPGAYEFTETAAAYLHSFYLNANLSNHARYMLTAGIRQNYYSRTKDLRVEPRIMFNYFPNDHVVLKMSGGLFNQYVTQISGVAIESVGGIENQAWQIADGKKVPVVTSKQGMAGAMYHSDSWIFDLEVYHNSIDHIAINNILTFSDNYFYGSGNTFGADLLLKKQWRNFDSWVSYTISKSRLKFDSISAQHFEFIYDQTHVIDVVAGYKFRHWKISAGWKYRTGLPALPGIRSRYIHGAPSFSASAPPPPNGNGAPGPGGYTDRFPPYQQIDLSVVYTFPRFKNSWSGTIGLSLLNIFDRENIVEQIPRPTPQGMVVGNKYAIGFAPSLMLTVRW